MRLCVPSCAQPGWAIDNAENPAPSCCWFYSFMCVFQTPGLTGRHRNDPLEVGYSVLSDSGSGLQYVPSKEGKLGCLISEYTWRSQTLQCTPPGERSFPLRKRVTFLCFGYISLS